MVSDIAELTRTLRKASQTAPGEAFGRDIRSRLRTVSEKIKADLNSNGRAIYTDEHGNRYLIERQPGTP